MIYISDLFVCHCGTILVIFRNGGKGAQAAPELPRGLEAPWRSLWRLLELIVESFEINLGAFGLYLAPFRESKRHSKRPPKATEPTEQKP